MARPAALVGALVLFAGQVAAGSRPSPVAPSAAPANVPHLRWTAWAVAAFFEPLAERALAHDGGLPREMRASRFSPTMTPALPARPDPGAER